MQRDSDAAMKQPYLPKGQITGVGSLPHRDASEAMAFVAEFSPVIPFWPQLPQRSADEGMIAQMMTPLRDLWNQRSPASLVVKPGELERFRQGLLEGEAVLQEQSAAGFFVFEHACQDGQFPAAALLKGQISGPMTLAGCIGSDEGSIAALPEVYDALANYLGRLAVWQIRRLEQFGKPVTIFIDEPILSFPSPPHYLLEGLKRLISTIRGAGALVGIHCCATPAPPALCSLQPDVISWNASYRLETFLQHSDVRAFVEAGGLLAFGLVPTRPHLDRFHSAERFGQWIVAVDEHYDIQAVAAQSLVTATCGLGLLSVEAARESFIKARELSLMVGRVCREA